MFVQSLFHLSGDLRLYTVRGIVLLIKVMLLFIFRIKSVIQILNAALLTQDNVLQRPWLGFTDFVQSVHLKCIFASHRKFAGIVFVLPR